MTQIPNNSFLLSQEKSQNIKTYATYLKHYMHAHMQSLNSIGQKTLFKMTQLSVVFFNNITGDRKLPRKYNLQFRLSGNSVTSVKVNETGKKM